MSAKQGVNTEFQSIAYSISFDGEVFLGNGGYRDQRKNIMANTNFAKAKTAMITLNAIIILSVAIFSVYVQYDSNNDKKEVERLNNELVRLKNQKDTQRKH